MCTHSAQALVKSGEIEQYAAAEGASTGSYVSFTQLLEKLQARLGGDFAAVGAGETLIRPLHVVLQKPAQVLRVLVEGGSFEGGFSHMLTWRHATAWYSFTHALYIHINCHHHKTHHHSRP